MKYNLPLKDKLELRCMPEPMSGCWLWTGSINTKGYGEIFYNHRLEKAHRASWICYKGPIPDGLHVCHKCDVRCCINPDHLFLGTNADNVADRERKGRTPLGESASSTKLTAKQVIEIRSIYKNGGISLLNLGKKFGVGETTIHSIVHKLTWKHI